MLSVKRSPARVTWHIVFDGQLIDTRDTRAEALARRDELARTYNLKVM